MLEGVSEIKMNTDEPGIFISKKAFNLVTHISDRNRLYPVGCALLGRSPVGIGKVLEFRHY